MGRLKWRTRPGRGHGGCATGKLAELPYDVKTHGQTTVGRLGSGVKYGKFVEGYPRAPRRHFVSFQTAPGLRDWAKTHGILFIGQDGKARAAWRGTGMIVGGEGSTTPFMRPALKARAPHLLPKLRAILQVGNG